MKKINDKLSGEWFEGQWTITGDAADVEEYINGLVTSGTAQDATENSFRTTPEYNRQQAAMAGFLRANGAEDMADAVMSYPPGTAPDLEKITLRDIALGFHYGSLMYFGNCDKNPEWEEAIIGTEEYSSTITEQFGTTAEAVIAEMDRLRPDLVY